MQRRIGYLPENVPLYLDMNVHEYLTFVGRARGLDGARLRERLDWCVEACGLRTEYRKNIGELSKGYRQRTGLAQALIHDPDILILDEPTSGLDPLQIIGIRDLIKSLAGHKTIIFSTHILQEVSPVTDRVVIINEGPHHRRRRRRRAGDAAPWAPTASSSAPAPRPALSRRRCAACRRSAELKPLRAGERLPLRGARPLRARTWWAPSRRWPAAQDWELIELHEAPYQPRGHVHRPDAPRRAA